MKKLGYVLTAILGLASIVGQAPVAAQSGASGVTGAAEASFSSGATFNGVPLRGLTVGQGVVFTRNGSATGQFQAVLLGNSILGALQDVIVEGEIQTGSVAADGSATFSGTATVNGGGGTLPVPGVPFVATVSTNSIALTLNATALPAAIVTAGNITIK
jgi:hypothetical protein